MKKILLLLLLATFSIQAQTLQNPTYGNVKLKNNTTDNSATKVNVQSTDGTINTISKSDLVNVVEANDVPSLPLIGEVGKIYVVKNVNKIYRWNGTFYQELAGSDISGLQAQIDLKANDSDVVKLTGNQSITGQKTFNNSSTGFGIFSSNSSTGFGIVSNNSSTGFGIFSSNSSTGFGIVSNNSSTGFGIVSNNSSTGNGIVSNQGVSGTGFNYVGQNNGTNTFTVNKLGATTATSFINSTAPANNILLAGGGDLAQGTAFNKNFGTTAGTVVEGGTLGSNAYSSTAYLPLSGGTINANNETINYKVSSNNGALYNSWYDFNNNRISFLGFGGGTQSNATFFVASGNGGNIALTTTGVGKVVVPSLSGASDGNIVADADGAIKRGTPLGSNAYTSTVIPTNTNQLTNGSGYITDISGKVDKVTGKSLIADSEITRLATVTNQDISGKENAFSKNTAFNKNFGTTAGTIVEGGTLGSNAYSSTAYLPLTGGTLSGALNGTSANFSSSVTATSFNGSATLTGTPTAPTAPVGTNTTQVATTAFVQANSSARPYKVYTALLNQSGTDAPVATVLENTLGGTVVWTRGSVGLYIGTLENGFSSTLSKVRIFISGGEPSQNATGFYNALPNHINSVQVNTRNTSGSLADSLMGTGATIEIRVYL